MKNYYEILEVNENASQEVIDRIYKLLAKKYHPDLNPDNLKEAEERFKEISEAYEVLGDVSKRKSYDLKLQSQRAAQNNNTYSNVPQNVYSKPNNEPPKATSNQNTNNENLYKQQEEALKRMQQEREYQIKKAYNDAYVSALESMGFKVKYKKTFKEHVDTVVSIILTIIALAILLLICWLIPYTKPYAEKIIEFLKYLFSFKDIFQ